ncbi:MAG: hypothetical protein J5I59_13500 [Saprospiraceae bacterium]|nr:hypothetical protein [Saprospiraceae bacterium]
MLKMIYLLIGVQWMIYSVVNKPSNTDVNIFDYHTNKYFGTISPCDENKHQFLDSLELTYWGVDSLYAYLGADTCNCNTSFDVYYPCAKAKLVHSFVKEISDLQLPDSTYKNIDFTEIESWYNDPINSRIFKSVFNLKRQHIKTPFINNFCFAMAAFKLDYSAVKGNMESYLKDMTPQKPIENGIIINSTSVDDR